MAGAGEARRKGVENDLEIHRLLGPQRAVVRDEAAAY